ncbi:MAG: avidin/streptavidin family protein [Acidimicrobiia bacterium]|nr:avidin/streptavidin family protein [Acidimicrobiia bacterium]
MFLETILADAVHVEQDTRKPASAISGRWRNELGSTMELTVDEHHQVHGTFHTEVGLLDPALTFPVAGFAEGDAFSFCVDFGRRGSVASWSGHHISEADGERLVTLWHLAQPVSDPHSEADVWGALMAGADQFLRAED